MPTNAFNLPDYHFLLLAPNLGVEWLHATRRYWARFRPTIVSEFAFMQLVPAGYTLAITVVARRDSADYLQVQVRQLFPTALYDPVIYDFMQDAQLTLDGRADINQPLGVPVPPSATPTSTPTLTPTFTPSVTPGPAPTRAPAGYITQTPPGG